MLCIFNLIKCRYGICVYKLCLFTKEHCYLTISKYTLNVYFVCNILIKQFLKAINLSKLNLRSIHSELVYRFQSSRDENLIIFKSNNIVHWTLQICIFLRFLVSNI